jgi:CRP-like cAMP-binding protein
MVWGNADYSARLHDVACEYRNVVAAPSGTIVAAHHDVTSVRRDGSLRIVRDGASDVGPSSNWLLGSLPTPVLAHLTPQLERVTLDRKQILFRAHERIGHVYFPATAIVSLVAASDSGETLEVGLTGRDGLAGAAALPVVDSMPCEGMVQIAGVAYRLDASLFRQALHNFEPLSAAVARYAHLLLVRSMQMQLCDAFHPVEQRLTRWLLAVNDLLASAEIPLTHEMLATMLGVRRPTVTVVVGSLQRAGLIQEQRGRITVFDRERLEAACCDCYGVMCEQQQEILGYSCTGTLAANS